MEKAHFDECIKHIGIRVGGKCSDDLSHLLFEEYEIQEDDRFSKACKWLSDYYEGAFNSFPSMPWFRKAMEATMKTFSNFEPIEVESYTKKDQEDAFKNVRKELIKMRLKTMRNGE